MIEPLALHNTVVAPDFPGHGESEPGGGDYSLGSLASGLRDLMIALGHERATLVGHSLGGGVALQFTYQFPEMVERLVLVSSGGLGPEVGAILRAAALPGADLFIRATAAPGAVAGGLDLRRRSARSACGPTPTWPRSAAPTPRSPTPTAARPSSRPSTRSSTPTASASPPSTASTSPRTCPVLIVWGERDPIIPVGHGRAAHAQLPGSHLEVFPDVGHVPMLESPGRFAAVLQRFLDDTEPAEFDGAEWRARFSGK